MEVDKNNNIVKIGDYVKYINSHALDDKTVFMSKIDGWLDINVYNYPISISVLSASKYPFTVGVDYKEIELATEEEIVLWKLEQ